MKTPIIITGVIVISFTILGALDSKDEQAQGTTPASEICEQISEAARAAMSARQTGVSRSAALRVAGRDPMLQRMVHNAWEQPRFETNTQRERMIVGFMWDYQEACLRDGSATSTSPFCERMGDAAEATMVARFERPMHYDQALVDASESEFGMDMAHDAYSHHYSDDPDVVGDAIVQFRAKYEDACMLLAAQNR